MKNSTLETLVWRLIYGGALLLMIGLWTRAGTPALGQLLVLAGLAVMAGGVGAFWWRSRRPDDSSPADREDR
ncbi:MAG TPA: hypothetical protein VNV16_00545 [Methylibium sp.]|nr:hypothetical protein [Methylibium sp.]